MTDIIPDRNHQTPETLTAEILTPSTSSAVPPDGSHEDIPEGEVPPLALFNLPGVETAGATETAEDAEPATTGSTPETTEPVPDQTTGSTGTTSQEDTPTHAVAAIATTHTFEGNIPAQDFDAGATTEIPVVKAPIDDSRDVIVAAPGPWYAAATPTYAAQPNGYGGTANLPAQNWQPRTQAETRPLGKILAIGAAVSGLVVAASTAAVLYLKPKEEQQPTQSASAVPGTSAEATPGQQTGSTVVDPDTEALIAQRPDLTEAQKNMLRWQPEQADPSDPEASFRTFYANLTGFMNNSGPRYGDMSRKPGETIQFIFSDEYLAYANRDPSAAKLVKAYEENAAFYSNVAFAGIGDYEWTKGHDSFIAYELTDISKVTSVGVNSEGQAVYQITYSDQVDYYPKETDLRDPGNRIVDSELSTTNGTVYMTYAEREQADGTTGLFPVLTKNPAS
ncbi:MAG: hypothetical protein WBP26_05650 [Candidatus Saccharimonadales bacterium]